MKASHRDHMFELMSQGIWQVDAAGKTIYVNSRMSRMVGYSREELELLPSLNFVHEEDRGWIAARLASRRHGVRDDYECQLAHKDGSWASVTIEAIPVYGDDGEFDGTLALVTDITERKRAEKNVRDAQHVGRVGSWDRNLRTGEIAWSDELCRIYGVDPKLPVPGLDEQARFYTPDSWTRLQAAVENTVNHGAPLDLDVQIVRADGKVIWATARGEALRSAAGQVVGTRGTIQDITERKRAENQLRESGERHRTIVQAAMDGFWAVDPQGRLMEVNDAYCRMSGYSAEELLTMRISDLEALESEADIAAHTERILTENGGRFETQHRRKDRSLFDVEISVTPSPDKSGRLVAFIRDITERKRAEMKIRDYQSKLQQAAFAETMAQEQVRRDVAVELHDSVGQLLALAQIKLKTLRAGMAGASPAVLDEAIGLVGRSLEDTRTLTFELSPPVLHDLGLRQALDWLGEDVEKRYGLRVALDDDGGNLRLDRDVEAIVFRAVRELLVNVAKHAKTNKAKVSLHTTESCVEVSVEDEGIGFDAAEVARVTAAGSFGLFSVQEHLRHLGGTVDVVSAPERGTRVSLRVPFDAPSARDALGSAKGGRLP